MKLVGKKKKAAKDEEEEAPPSKPKKEKSKDKTKKKAGKTPKDDGTAPAKKKKEKKKRSSVAKEPDEDEAPTPREIDEEASPAPSDDDDDETPPGKGSGSKKKKGKKKKVAGSQKKKAAGTDDEEEEAQTEEDIDDEASSEAPSDDDDKDDGEDDDEDDEDSADGKKKGKNKEFPKADTAATKGNKKNSAETKRNGKKGKAPPKRLVEAEKMAPSDDDDTTPGIGGEMTPEQAEVVRAVLQIKSDEKFEKFKEYFTPEEIARVKENFKDPSKRKLLKPKKAPTSDVQTGFAKYNGGPQAFVGLDPSKWRLQKFRFNGKAKCEVKGELEEIRAPIKEGLLHFLTTPITNIAMMFQSNMMDFHPSRQKFTLLHRLGTYQYRPQDTWELDDPDAEGIFTLLMWTYEHLPPFPNDEMPMKARDKYTDNMTYMGVALHENGNLPIMPGRGMGIGDAPNLCVIRDVDPTDVYQGTVGDCWLLGAISSLAEFDGAIQRMFRKTKLLHKRPLPGPNMYTITLYDIEKWKPVDYHIDERLPSKGDGSGKLLACRLSGYGELWPALLEKAMAIHCGGWDAIYGGNCSHAWSIMTGCKEQYTIERNAKTGNWFCLTKFNPNTRKWEQHYNNGKEDPGHNMWKSDWPKVGGGGSGEITDDDLFRRICQWDDVNFVMSAATTGSGNVSSIGQDSGLVEDHAYSLVEAHDNVAGTGIGLLNVRNPWGSGEIKDGQFDDDGPGWEEYPEIEEELNPVFTDDGAFWVTKEEFFRFYQTIYLSASNMTRFLED